MKSIYENMKNLLDPTPRFDSHTSKNASKVTSLSSYRALELTQVKTHTLGQRYFHTNDTSHFICWTVTIIMLMLLTAFSVVNKALK